MFEFDFQFEFEGKQYTARCKDVRDVNMHFYCFLQDKNQLKKYRDAPIRLHWQRKNRVAVSYQEDPAQKDFLSALAAGLNRYLRDFK